MDADDLAYAGAARQADLITSREVSSREVVQACLDRIERIDRAQLNAFRVVWPERALAAADEADRRVAAGESAPLLGVPVAIKDDADVEGEYTGWGTNAHGERPAPSDAPVVAALRSAGAVFVGKTNVPELTIWPFTETPTWGATRNPWDRQRTPGGSSGGSAAAVAAGLCGVALGSDGGGSIRIPSGACGLFGLKPQSGRIPNRSASNAWHGLSSFGAMARSVADSALFMDAVTGGAHGYGSAVVRDPGRLRISISLKVPPLLLAKLSGEQRSAVERMAALLRELGHEVTERDLPYTTNGVPQFLARYYRGIHDDAMALPHPERLARRTKGMVRMGKLVHPAVLQRALDARAAEQVALGAAFDTADVVLTPMFTRLPPAIGEFDGLGAQRTFDAVSRWVPFCAPFNVTGQPAASVPAGWAEEGVPLAVQLVGRPDDEATLYALGAQIEAARPWADRRPAL